MAEKRIVFVCTGNVCRSPMAEYLLRARLGADSEWTVSSAGLAAGVGMTASLPAVRVLAEEGIDLTPHRSRPLDRSLVDAATIIVVMTAAHRRQMAFGFPDAMERVFLLGSFGPGRGDVPDPIGLADEAYDRIRDLISEALPDLLSFLETLDVR